MTHDVLKVKKKVYELVRHFNYSDKLIDILTICYMAITDGDMEIEDIVDEVYSRNYIYFNNGLYNEKLSKYYPDLASDKLLGMYMPPSFNESGITRDSFLVINAYKFDNYYELFKTILHELKHALNNIINIFGINSDGMSYMDCGFLRYRKHGNTVRFVGYYLEEAFNCYMTDIYLNNVLKIKDWDLNVESIRGILDNFDVKKEKEDPFYVRLLLDLFEDNRIFGLFYNVCLYKDFDSLERKLSKIFDTDMEGELIEEFKIDYIDYLLENFDNQNGVYDIWNYFNDKLHTIRLHKKRCLV